MPESKPETLKKLQHGGLHYKDLVIEPVEYAQKNQLNACEFSVVKYITRHRRKNGVEDLKKAIHFIQILLEMEYGKTASVHYLDEDKPPVMELHDLTVNDKYNYERTSPKPPVKRGGPYQPEDELPL